MKAHTAVRLRRHLALDGTVGAAARDERFAVARPRDKYTIGESAMRYSVTVDGSCRFRRYTG